jgi:hypothetical protein
MDLAPPVIAALATGAVSLIVAVLTYFSVKLNQREVEKLKAELAERNSERDARRDYEYEARKRLYQEYEPLFFQFTESAEVALSHIQSLAERGREGHLGNDGYLSGNSYYLKTTIYKLLVPIVIFKLINKRLTLVDLQLDAKIHTQYCLAKLLYSAYAQDMIFARLPPNLEYNPYQPGWSELRKDVPQIFYRQGFPLGRLDNALESLITHDGPEGNVLSFGRFEEMIELLEKTDVRSSLGVAKDMFFSFHPQRRPVLWRILICQACIYRCVLGIRYGNKDIRILRGMVENFCPNEQERRKYDWRQNKTEAPDGVVLEEPFLVAKAYFKQKISEPLILS